MKPNYLRPLRTASALLALAAAPLHSAPLAAQSPGNGAAAIQAKASAGDASSQLDRLFALEDGQDTSFVREIFLNLRSGDTRARAALEKKILDRSASGKLTDAAKRSVAELLSWIGTEKSVDLLSTWATEPNVGDASIRALAAIPGAPAERGLIQLLGKVTADVQPSVLDALGHRGAGKAVDYIKPLLNSNVPNVAVAALSALSRIASREAVEVLTQARVGEQLESDRIWALLHAAHQQVERGQGRAAQKTFQSILKSGASVPQRVAAAEGLIQSGGPEGLNATMDLLTGSETEVGRRLAPHWLRAAVDPKQGGSGKPIAALSKDFGRVAPAVQEALLAKAQQLGSKAALPLITAGLQSAVPETRTAALLALGRSTDSLAALTPLFDALNIPSERETAITALSRSRAEGVDAQVRGMYAAATVPTQAGLITLAAQRVDREMFDAVIQGAQSEDRDLRQASFRALASLARQDDLPGLLTMRGGIRTGAERRAWHEALLTVVRGSESPEQAAALLGEHLSSAISTERATFAIALTLLNNPAADKLLRRMLADPDETKRKEVVRALSSARNLKSAELLIEHAEAAKEETEQVLALRGYIETIDPLNLSTAEKLVSYRRALKSAVRDEERLAVLSGVDKLRGPDVKTLSKELHQLLPSAPPAPPSLQ